MKTYRYALDRSPRKWICPRCGQKTFVRYVDTFSGEYVKDARSGRCDRQIKCRYHLPPREADLSGQGTCIKPVTVRPRRICTLDIDPQPFYNKFIIIITIFSYGICFCYHMSNSFWKNFCTYIIFIKICYYIFMSFKIYWF